MPESDALTASVLQDIRSPLNECLVPRKPVPCALVIFGATGDLTARKLFPALFGLYCNGGLPEHVTITGAARSNMDSQSFRERMRSALEEAGQFNPAAWEALAPRIFYQPLDYSSPEGFQTLAERLAEHDETYGTRGNRLFYLATPPTVYQDTARMLGAAGLAKERNSFARMVIEKPFGRDLNSARALDQTLHQYFAEHQIFRIDHYLAKETVQNILLFRFANAIFEPVWNRRYIASVTCASLESLGIGHRAGYYEQSGVLRDMFQNHMMQLMSLVAIEPPVRFEADQVRDEKVKVYRALRPFDPVRLHQDLVLGQYGPGSMNGQAVPGYTHEPGVDPNSTTPTFAMIRTWVDNWRWQGVPFHIISGKRMREKITRISITFREAPHAMFQHLLPETMPPNKLVMDIHPDNAISITFQSKLPGPNICPQPVTMRFDFESTGTKALSAYEKVLLDCMLGDHMLFWRQDGVELTWGFLSPILDQCEACGDPGALIHPYAAGSWGPEASLDVLHGVV